jgi:hypothetical protein
LQAEFKGEFFAANPRPHDRVDLLDIAPKPEVLSRDSLAGPPARDRLFAHDFTQNRDGQKQFSQLLQISLIPIRGYLIAIWLTFGRFAPQEG